ncbi:MAG TPA: hypothetical protein VHF26_09175, partial [Trebonia sp.]|nr:hypothetical protein [Trebonia sp.]
MAKRGFLSMLAVPVAGSALLGGLPGTAAAVTTAPATAPARAAGAPGGPLTPALASRLARNVDKPVSVILMNQARQPGAAGPAVSASATASAAATSALTSLQSELKQVHAAGIKRFSLVNSIAATVSLLEEQRLAADPAVARVIPDETITVPAPAPPASV